MRYAEKTAKKELQLQKSTMKDRISNPVIHLKEHRNRKNKN